MSEMVERVAKAIKQAHHLGLYDHEAETLARAAIAAMREPDRRREFLERCYCLRCDSTAIAYDLTEEEAGAEVS